jgi:hypothetical protein
MKIFLGEICFSNQLRNIIPLLSGRHELFPNEIIPNVKIPNPENGKNPERKNPSLVPSPQA